ncbi:MAG: 3-oxoacyl-ACP synthase [Bdellovibrionales bacterium GWB1_55_8]|nr:MAG: 3-oxoacyl-ACP synthase [Bdellovibrionales bacterium GWB1_55_8]
MKYSRIVGIGSYLPEKVWRNDDLRALMDTSDEWIQQRTGIKQRHWVDQDSTEGTSDLALKAAVGALESAGVAKEELDLIVVATVSPDHEFPGTACFLQAKLGVSGIPALDVRQQCTGFLYAISIADQFIRTGTYKKVLVVGAEIHSRGLDKTTEGRDMSVLFGDGAGAVVMVATDDPNSSRVLSTHLHADGRFAKELWIPAPSNAGPGPRITEEHVRSGAIYGKMNGKSVFVHAAKRMPEAVNEALAANGFSLSDIDLFVFHQANLRINEMVAKQLGIPEEKVFNTIDRFANTTAATIPLGLHEALRVGKLKPGMLVATAAFGSGFTWGSALIRW